jgi:hypothetical protein
MKRSNQFKTNNPTKLIKYSLFHNRIFDHSTVDKESNNYNSHNLKQKISNMSNNIIDHVSISSEVSKEESYISYPKISNLPLGKRDPYGSFIQISLEEIGRDSHAQ